MISNSNHKGISQKHAYWSITIGALAWFSYQKIQAIFSLLIEMGNSAIEWTYSLYLPQNFQGNFPNSIVNFGRCLILSIYPGLYSGLNLTPEKTSQVMVVLEVLFSALAFFWLGRSVCRKPTIGAICALLWIAVATGIREMDLARFGYPYLGMYYHLLDLTRIGGFIFVLRRKPVPASILLALSFMIHPAQALMGVVVAVALLIPYLQEIRLRDGIIATSIFFVLSGLWFLVAYRDAGLAVGEIPAEQWFALSELSSFHWYSFAEYYKGEIGPGIFLHEGRFFGLLSLLLLFAHYFRREVPQRYQQGILCAMMAVGLMSAIGILNSWFNLHAGLIKLALHRSSDIWIIFALPVLVCGLWKDLSSNSFLESVLAFLLLLSPMMVDKGGFPLLCTLGLIGLRGRFALRFCIGLLMIVAWLVTVHDGVNWKGQPSLAGLFVFHKGWTIAALLGLVASLYLFRRRQLSTLYTLVAMFAFGIVFNPLARSEESKAQLLEAKKAQLWARNHTEPGSLFMPDPVRGGGWSVFSRRASFGTFRDWVYLGWVYNADRRIFDMGLQRIAEFGLNVWDYTGTQPLNKGYFRLAAEIERRYHQYPDSWRRRMAEKYGIDYFVYIRHQFRAETQLPVVYQNNHYLILKAAPIHPLAQFSQ